MRTFARSQSARRVGIAVVLVMAVACTVDGPQGAVTRPSGPDCARGVGTDEYTHQSARVVLVHLPACYSETDRRYPVIYLLHGAGADETQWVDIGTTVEIDRLAERGEIGQALLVAPDQGDVPAAGRAAEVPELVTWADSNYRTIADRDHRSIGGISRGGQAALSAAAHDPALFGSVAGHSTTLPPDREELLVGLRPLTGHVWLDAGASDPLLDEVVSFAADLERTGTANSLVIAPGGHDRDYWRASIDSYLRFYAHRWL